MAADVPFIFDGNSSSVAGYTSDQIEKAHISSPDLAGVPTITQVADDDVLDFPITGGDNTPIGTTEKKVSDLKIEFDTRVEPENSRVNEEAVVLALKYPGDLTIDQIASIYSYLKNGDGSKNGWGYVRDPRGIDYLRYANASLELGDRADCVGGGDCDDFAILMAALVESVGGTTRIILANNNSTGGHAYTEVYLGQLGAQNSQVEDIISWLKQSYDTDKIYTHIETDTKDVWLNLDWGPDKRGNAHPGGPFFRGDRHIVINIRDKYEKTPLMLSEFAAVGARESEMTNETPSGNNITIQADMMGYATLAFTMPKQIVVEAETVGVWNYTRGRGVWATMLLNGSRVSLALLYPWEPPQIVLGQGAMKSLLEDSYPDMIQATYSDASLSIGGRPAILGQLENQIFVAYQPTNENPVLIWVDRDMNEEIMADFLENLQINVNEGNSPLAETRPAGETEDPEFIAERAAAMAKLEEARSKEKGF